MQKLPRHLPIHYEDYAPDLAPEQRKAFYGLPKNVQFCRECVMSRSPTAATSLSTPFIP